MSDAGSTPHRNADISPEVGESLASYLRRARTLDQKTWDDLVRATDLSLGAIRKLEEGRTQNPGVFTVLAVLRALGLPASVLDAFAAPTVDEAGTQPSDALAARSGENAG